jgi:hypothetical protein
VAYIGRPSIVGNFVKLDAISVVNGQAAYTMQNSSANFTDYSTVNQFMVSLNGTIQSPGSSFTVSGSTITFASNLVTNDVIDFIIVFGNSLSSGVPTDATVTTAKLDATSVKTSTIWQSSIQTADFTASGNKGYWLNTSSGAITVTLPASPSVGDVLEFSDYSRSWGTNAVTLSLNSLKFQGGTKNPVYDTNGESIKIIYSGTTKGWIPSNDGAVADEGNFQAYNIDFLVIGGGGYGRVGSPGGGGAGGYRNSYSSETSGRGSSSESSLTLADATYTITVGAGGTSDNGVNSSIAGSGITTVTSLGGGYGGSGSQAGNSGGAGGGAGQNSTSGGAGTSGQGYDGGHSNGGGGGAGGAGNNGYGASAGLPNGGLGGSGLASSITGSSVTRASGGSAYYAAPSPTRSANVTGGGGGASTTNGTANTGGGGAADGGNGGSGVVILRIPTANYSGTTSGSPTVSTSGSDTILIFTGSGSYTA